MYVSLFFRARAITLVCEGLLAIGMKVGSYVEMESPGPRLYTHLPTRAGGQDRARGPRPSSPEPPGGAPLLVFSSPPFLDSTYLILLLSLSLPPTPLPRSCCLSLSLPSLSFSLAHSLACSLASALRLARRFLRSFPFRPTPSTAGVRLVIPIRFSMSGSRIRGMARVADPLLSRLGRAWVFCPS